MPVLGCRWIWVGALGIVVTGCGPKVHFEKLAEPPHAMAAKGIDSVVVVRAPERAQGILVGRLTATSRTHVSFDAQEGETLPLLREAGAAHGCDTIEVDTAQAHLFATSNGTPLNKTTQHAGCFVNR